MIGFWGGRSISFVNLKTLSNDIDLIVKNEKSINDWIMYFSFGVSNNEGFILSSHNIVISIDININDLKNSLIIKNIINCGEKSLLYSGTIQVINKDKILIGSGTVLGSILIWDLKSNLTNKDFIKLNGHEGSIFGITISSDGTRVISCSDDRSIRMWDIDSNSMDNYEKCIAIGWGHFARIWGLQFLNDNEHIFSISEDCTCRLWHLNDSKNELICDEIFENHLSKNIWSSDINLTNMISVTSGGDGRIRLQNLTKYENLNKTMKSWLPNDLSNDLLKFKKNEIFKDFKILNNNISIITTSEGKVLSLNNNDNNWSLLYQTNDLLSFSKIKGWENLNIVIIASRNGNISLLLINSNGKINKKIDFCINDKLKGKLSDIILTSEYKNKNDNNNSYIGYILSETQNPNDPFILNKIIYKNNDLKIKSAKILLPEPSFLCTTIEYIYDFNLLILGSRFGALSIYKINNDDDNDNDNDNDNEIFEKIKASNCWRRVMSEDAITSINIISTNISKREIILSLTGRLGTYLYIKLTLPPSFNNPTTTNNSQLQSNNNNDNKDDIKMEIIHSNLFSKGFLEKSINHKEGLLLFGFKNNNFYIWNESKQIEILKINCGGVHRSWSILIDSKNINKFTFMFVKSSKLYIVSSISNSITDDKEDDEKFKSSLLQEGTHGREIRSVIISPILSHLNTRLIATAAEDTCVRLGKLNSNGIIKYYWSERKHVSGIQSMKWHETPELLYLISSAAREELFIWEVREEEIISNDKLSLTNEEEKLPLIHHKTSLPQLVSNPDLRIMNFDILNIYDDNYNVIGLLISTVYSDSSIKIWFYNIIKNNFKNLISGFYLSCCILNTCFLIFKKSLYLIISSTDGHLTIYSLTKSLNNFKIFVSNENSLIISNFNDSLNQNIEPLSGKILRLQIHQSSIKGLLVINPNNSTTNESNDNQISIITGGDDNAIVLTKLTVINDEIINGSIIQKIDSAASSTITSLSIIENSNYFISTSVDQILRLWFLKNNEIILKDYKYTTVADTGCSDTTIINEIPLILIGGAGLSSWNL